MKLTVFFITFIAYAANHACRMSLSYNKPNLKQVFGFTSLQLGIMDSIIFISYGIGSFFRFLIFPERYLSRIYLIGSIFISLFFAVIPLLCLIWQQDLVYHIANNKSMTHYHIFVYVCLAGYGFSNLAGWQIMLTYMSRHWSQKQQGSEIGLWTAMQCIGNVFSFLTCNIMTQYFDLKWQTTMMLFSILNLVAALCLHYCLRTYDEQYIYHEENQTIETSKSFDLNQTNNQNKIQLKGQKKIMLQKQITFSQFWQFNMKKWRSGAIFPLYLLNSSLLKILNYSFLLWYPMFLYSQGFQNVKGYIIVVFQISSIFGSCILGNLFSYDKCTGGKFGLNDEQDSLCLKILTVLVQLRVAIIMVSSVIMVILFLMNFRSLQSNLVLTVFLGFTIGGAFHVNCAVNAFKFGQHIPRNVDMVFNFNTAVSTTNLGISQFIIGLMIYYDIDLGINFDFYSSNKKMSQYSNFFILVIFLMLSIGLISFLRSSVPKMICPPDQNQLNKQDQIQQ